MIQTIKIEASPHLGQKRVHDHPARFKVLACGRRWGKTRLGVHECLDVAAQGGRAWWVAPSYKMCEVGWRPLRNMGAKIGAEIRKVDRTIIMPNGGTVTVRSADNPDSLRGEGLDFVVLDECAFVREGAWNEALRPALSDRLGRAMFISTPKGRNWFYFVYQRGRDEADMDWQSWSFPTTDNPYIPDDEIDAARRQLPELIFRQEYQAEFLDDAGGVFRGVANAATSTPLDEALPGHQYVMGVDWGRQADFTVISVLDVQEKRQVYLDRFTQIDYEIQTSRLRNAVNRFKPTVVSAEYNSMGGPIIERLHSEGLPIQGFQTTQKTKEPLIRGLESAFDNGELRILPDPVQVAELQAYEQEQLTMYLRFGAPEGMHDDTVIALALAYQGLIVPPPAGTIIDDLDMSIYKSKRTTIWD